jgi:tetratricopeptide (TPR) repeat protein
MMAANLNLLGVLSYYTFGEYQAGGNYLEQALAIFQELGNRYGEATMLNNIGENARMQGDFGAAVERYQAALAITLEFGNPSIERSQRTNLAGALVGKGDYKAAVAELEYLIKDGGVHWRLRSESNRFLAQARFGLGKFGLALEAAKEALALALLKNLPYEVGRAWRVLGQIAAQMGQPIIIEDKAEMMYDAPACFAKSIEIFTELAVDRERALAMWRWADFELLQGDKEVGEQMWQKARNLFMELNLPLFVARMDLK